MTNPTTTLITADSEPASVPLNWVAEIEPGRILAGRYRIVRLIGSGGMGNVYEVEHVALEHRCALKVMLPGLLRRSGAIERFHREARVMAKIRNAHVTQVLDFGTLEGGIPFIAMELLRGNDLARVLERDGPLEIERTLSLALDACSALIALHEAGLVHRDVKPANLFVTEHPSGREYCKLLDLGVITSGPTADNHREQLVGTLRYMAPEQLDGKPIDPRTDVYALSTVLYECLAGRPPHDSARLERVLFGIMNTTPRPLTELRSEIPAGLSCAISRGLSREAEQRFDSMQQFADTLRSFLAVRVDLPEGNAASVTTRSSPPQRRSTRRLRYLASVVGFTAAGILGGWAMASKLRILAPQLAPAPSSSSSDAPEGHSTLSRRNPQPVDESVANVVRPTDVATHQTSVSPTTEGSSSARRGDRGQPPQSQVQLARRVPGAELIAAIATNPAPPSRDGSELSSLKSQVRPSVEAGAHLLRVGADVSATAIDPHNPYAK